MSKEESIIAAGRKLFTHYGLKKTTVDDIAKEAGIAKGTIYLYFKNKDEIFSKVLNSVAHNLIREERQVLALPLTPVEKLRQFLFVRFTYIDDLIATVNLDILREHHAHPYMQELRDRYSREEQQVIQAIIKEGVEKKIFHCDDPAVASMVLSYAFQGLDMPWVWEGKELVLEKKIDMLLQVFIYGLKSKD
jgi:AcrR family transcriptional regulator